MRTEHLCARYPQGKHGTVVMFIAHSSYLSPLLILISVFLLAGCDSAKTPDTYSDVATQGAYTIELNHEGNAAFVGSLHHGGSYWTLVPPDRHFDWNHKAEGYSSLSSAAFAPDGDFVATTDKRTIVLWSVATGESVWYWNAPGDIEDIALTAHGELALLGLSDYTATLFDIRNGGIRQRLAHEGTVYDVSLNNEGLIGATASDDLTAVVWNLNDGSRIQTFTHNNQVKTAEISPSGRLLFTSALGEPGRVWEVSSGNLLFELPGGRGHFSAASFNANEQYLATGNTSGQIQLWNLSDGNEKERWRATAGDKWVGNNVQVEDVTFSSNGIVAAGANGRIYHMAF
jgi:WD40 repeat protein